MHAKRQGQLYRLAKDVGLTALVAGLTRLLSLLVRR